MDLIDALRARLPDECLQTDADVIEAYSHDRAIFEAHGTAAVLVMPRNTDDVVAAVEAANEAGVPIVPRGAGTGLTGAANASTAAVSAAHGRLSASTIVRR